MELIHSRGTYRYILSDDQSFKLLSLLLNQYHIMFELSYIFVYILLHEIWKLARGNLSSFLERDDKMD